MSVTLFGENEARYAALSGLVQGARVLDLALHADARCVDALVTAGARSITVCAPERIRADLTTQNVELRLVPPVALPLEFAPRTFDVIVCFDLIARIAQDPSWMSSLREVLHPNGCLVIATSSADDAAGILGEPFGVATVFAQTPLVGHLLYDIAADELEPELDRTWADGGDEEPTTYVVVFAPEEKHNEKLTMVQMPFGAWEKVTGAELEGVRAERDYLKAQLAAVSDQLARAAWQADNDAQSSAQQENDNLRSELEVAVGELETLRHELEQLRAAGAVGDANEELARHRADRASLEAQIADLLEESAVMSAKSLAWEDQRESSARDHARIAELEDAIAMERAAAAQAQQATADERVELQRRFDDLQRALDASRQRGDDLARRLDLESQQTADLKDALENARNQAGALEKELAVKTAKEIAEPTGEKALDGES